MTSQPAAEPAPSPRAEPRPATAGSPAQQPVPPASALPRLRALHHAAERAMDGARAVLLDRGTQPQEALPLLQLGWMRALELLLLLGGGRPAPGTARPEWLMTSPAHRLPDPARARVLTDLHLLWSEAEALRAGQPFNAPTRRVVDRRLGDLHAVLRTLRRPAGVGTLTLVRRRLGAPTLLAVSAVAVCVGLALVTTRQATQEFGWHGQYFRNEELTGEAVPQKEAKVAFYWDDGAPVYGLGTEHWSARFEGCLPVAEAGPVRFAVGSDDGSRVLVNDKLLVDHWGRHSLVFKEASVELARGVHLVRVEYFDYTRAANLVLKVAAGDGPLRVLEEREVLYPNFRDGAATCDGLEP